MYECVSDLLTFVGFYALSCYLYENLRTAFGLLLRSLRKIVGDASEEKSLKQRFGTWAAITGSSDGIGKAYAKELARQGLNVVLIARNPEKLQAVAKEIETLYAVKTKVIIADFTKGSEIYAHIEHELEQVPVGILINNVGMNVSKPGPLMDCSHEELQNVIGTNIVAVTQLSRYFMLRMRRTNTKGAIVNVSSGTEMQPLPFAALYAASKAYTRYLTLALQVEARPYGIHVQLLSPNFVVTKINSFSKLIMRGGLFIPDADTYARSAVALLAKEVDSTSGYFLHAVQNFAFKIIPERLRIWFVEGVFKIIADKTTH